MKNGNSIVGIYVYINPKLLGHFIEHKHLIYEEFLLINDVDVCGSFSKEHVGN